MLCLFHRADVRAEARTASAGAQAKAAANWLQSSCFHCCRLSKKFQLSTKISLTKQQTYFVKSWISRTHLFKILCDKMCDTESILLWSEIWLLSQEKYLCDCIARLSYSAFSCNKFYSKNLWLFRVGFFGRLCIERNDVGLLLQGKQLAVFFASDNTWAFKYNLEYFPLLCGSWRPACDKKYFPLRSIFRCLWWTPWRY